ncbi:ATP-binding cassette domain-containing protein [archaeon]|nr:MAG: ATP-binding cassette domain-containing protein [archaeon]
MNVLSGRIPFNRKTKLTGYIYYNGEYLDQGMTSKNVAYVAQDEHIFAFLTVRETLCLAAYFHSPMHATKQELKEKVDAVMRELGLVGAADTILGNETRRGVSGGEYRRVLIGRELIKNPSTIFLDEPTSGLDSFQALSVMDTMKKLASNNRIVMSVIHQPRSSIFAMFDRLLLLSEGKLMYFGSSEQALQYFSSLGYPCPQHFNPADYFLDILSVNMKSTVQEQETRSRIAFFEKAFMQAKGDMPIEGPHVERRVSSSRGSSTGSGGGGIRAGSGSDVVERVSYSKDAFTSWLKDFGVLLWRSNANIYRNYAAILIRGLTTLFFAVLISLIYRNLTYDQRGIQNRTGLLYFALINQVCIAYV